MVAVFLPVPNGASPTSHFELNIPLRTIQSLCFAPVKWLRFVGWTIFLTPNGYLSHDSQGTERLPDDYMLQNEDILYYQAVGLAPRNAVDIDVVRRRTESDISHNDTRKPEFRRALLDRDRACVFSGWPGQACHIIPFARGSEWMKILVNQRSIQPPINDINDEQNGYICSVTIHQLIDNRELAVLVTPNDILEPNDIPSSLHIGNPDDHRPNPPNLRYTLQRLAVKDPLEAQFLDYALARNNQDARFQNCSPLRLPNSALLHYVYGASIMITYGTPETVKAWRCLHGWDRLAIQASLSTGRDHDRTEEKRHEASACGVQDSGDPTVEEEAMDFIMNVGLMQMARREREKWERRKSEIGRWAESLPRGVSEEKTI